MRTGRSRVMNIVLKQWDASMKDDLMRICNSVDRTYLSGRMPEPYTEADAEWWLGKVAEEEGKAGVFRAIYVDGEIAGNITVEQKSDVSCKDAELGYCLMTEYWSQGIMTEATRQICGTAFDELDIIRLSSIVYSPNIASRRVLEKSGFIYEGCQRNAIFKDGKVWDALLFGMLKEER